MPFTEANFENAIIEIFRDMLGYEYLYGPDVVRDFSEPLCVDILEDALVRINPSLPRPAIDEAIARIKSLESGSLARKNAHFTDMLQNGVAVNYFDGSEQRAGLVRLVDYDLPMRNRFTVANQWTVEERSVRRPDIVVFVNGLPLVVVELKSPARGDRRLGGLCPAAQLHAGDSLAVRLQRLLRDERPGYDQGRDHHGG